MAGEVTMSIDGDELNGWDLALEVDGHLEATKLCHAKGSVESQIHSWQAEHQLQGTCTDHSGDFPNLDDN